MRHQGPVTLDKNENHHGPAPACLAALRELDPQTLHDYSRDYQAGSYSSLSRRLAALHGVEEKRILLGYGCEDILKEAVQHYVRQGGVLLVPSASWWYYRAVADEVGGKTAEYPLVETPTFYRYDMPGLLAALARGPVSLLLIASPNNPTGNRISRAELRAALDEARGTPVILDQAYFGLVDDGPDDWAGLTAEYPNLLILRSFSKLFGLAGARIGYAIAGAGHDTFVKTASRSLGYNRVSEAVAHAALDSPEYYERVRREMTEDRDRLRDSLRLMGARAYESDANFLLARFPKEIVGTLDTELRRRGLIVKFFTERAFLDCARITIGTPAENAALLAALTAVLPALLPAAI